MDYSKFAAPVLSALVIGVIAATGLWAHQAWLAPSLGSAVLAQVLSPTETAARPYNIALGQLIGLASGFDGVFATSVASAPPFTGDQHLIGARVGAAVIAMFIAPALQLITKATTPAVGATAVIVALGMESSDRPGAWRLLVGIALVTALGEAARQISLRLASPKR